MNPNRVLFLRLQGMGDLLMATPALRAARKAWPHAELDLMAGREAVQAVRGLPYLDRVVPIDARWFFQRRWGRMFRLALAQRARRYDLAVLFSRSAALHGWARLAGARQVASLRAGGLLSRPPRERDWRRARYEVTDNLAMMRRLGVPPQGEAMAFAVGAEARRDARRRLQAAGIGSYLVIAPGGGRNEAWDTPLKRWPADRFGSLAGRLWEKYRLATVVVGGPCDAGRAERIAGTSAGPVLDTTRRGSLELTGALLAAGRLVVTNDSVSMHLGLALGAPTLALFGPTNPFALLPRRHPRLKTLQPPVHCAPCFWQTAARVRPAMGRGGGFACPRPQRPCLAQLSVGDVMAAAEALAGLDRSGKGEIRC